MDAKTIALALIALFSWGIGSFTAKLATNRIGNSTIFWDMVGFTIITAIYALVVFKPAALIVHDKAGLWLAILSGVTGAIGGVVFYLLLVRKDASVVVPLTAVYPALTAILAFIFLRESLTLTKVAGIILATLAVYLLSL